jgi:DNA-binding ferritin-like protein (Dps family)
MSMTDDQWMDESIRGKRETRIARFVREKREWREHVRRVKALPGDFRFTMEQIEKYMWNFALDAKMIGVFDDILDLFEDGAASGRGVLEVTGQDVAAFCQSVLVEMWSNTWTGKKAEELNRAVRERVQNAAGNE